MSSSPKGIPRLKPWEEVKPVPSSSPPPPEGLSPAARSWWRQMTAAYVFGAGELSVLTTAVEAWDQAQVALAATRRDGLVSVTDKGQPRAHPGHAVYRDCTGIYLRCLHVMHLDWVPPPGPRRPGDHRPGPVGAKSMKA